MDALWEKAPKVSFIERNEIFRVAKVATLVCIPNAYGNCREQHYQYKSNFQACAFRDFHSAARSLGKPIGFPEHPYVITAESVRW